MAAPTTASGVTIYWLPDRKTRETFVVTHSSTTVAALALYLYGDMAAGAELASLNHLDPGAALGPGARLKVAPLGGRKPTTAAARSFKESPWFPVGTRDPAAVLAGMGVSNPAGFTARKRQLDVQLEQDFQIIVAKLNESHYSAADEGEVLDILRRWGEEKVTAQPERYPSGGDYLEQLFRRLRGKTKDVGIVTDQVSNYYSTMFNHFDRVDELKAIRDTYAPSYRRDSGFGEMGLGSFFWEEVKSGAIRDQIFAYFKGVGKGAWAGLKGTVKFAKTLATDPGKAWQQVKSMPGAVKALWKNRGALWDQFVNASPEEQAEIIGKLVGEIEYSLASAGAGGAAVRGVTALGQAPGWLGKAARVVGAVTSAPGKAVRAIRGAVAGAASLALGPIRAGAQSVSGFLRRLATRLKPPWRRKPKAAAQPPALAHHDPAVEARLAAKIPRTKKGGTRRAAGELHLDDGSEPVEFMEKAGKPHLPPEEGLTKPERHILRPKEKRVKAQPPDEFVPREGTGRTEAYLGKNALRRFWRFWKLETHPYRRTHDAEAKLLVRASQRLAKAPSTAGVLYLRPSHPPCAACTAAIFDFTGRHPNVRVLLY